MTHADPNCKDCNTALETDLWGGYSFKCVCCRSRMLARSLDAFNALAPNGSGDVNALRTAIKAMLSGQEFKEAKAMVWAWWQQDHKKTGNK